MELCSDETHFGLQKEVIHLTAVKRNLMEQINNLKTHYNGLHDHCTRIAQDLSQKNHSLSTDVKCLDERERNKNFSGCSVDNTQTGRNLQLSGMKAEIPNQRYK